MGSHGIRIVTATIVVAAVVGCFAATVLAQPAPQVITIDEFGNGTDINGAPIPAFMFLDDGPGGSPTTLTLTYWTGPLAVVAGDVILVEPLQGGWSDIVRFNPAEGIVFYSDASDGADAPADVAFPTALYPNNVSIPEIGAEGNNYADYTPAPGQPGYREGLPGLSYHFISDSDVPEPATMLLLGTGAVGLIGCLRRRSMK